MITTIVVTHWFILYFIWGLSIVMGVPHSWMVEVMGNPTKIWMMILGYPYDSGNLHDPSVMTPPPRPAEASSFPPAPPPPRSAPPRSAPRGRRCCPWSPQRPGKRWQKVVAFCWIVLDQSFESKMWKLKKYCSKKSFLRFFQDWGSFL